MKTTEVVNKEEMCEKGEEIYKKIKNELEPQHRGEFVAIEVDSGDYFLGKRPQDADGKARERYPDKVFYLARVGRKAAFVMR